MLGIISLHCFGGVFTHRLVNHRVIDIRANPWLDDHRINRGLPDPDCRTQHARRLTL